VIISGDNFFYFFFVTYLHSGYPLRKDYAILGCSEPSTIYLLE